MKRVVFGGVIVLVAVGILVVTLRMRQKPQGNDDVVRLGYSRLRISLPIFVAQEKGIFTKHGLNVKLEMYDTAQPLMQALVEGKTDVAGYTALPITYSGMLRSGKKLYFLTTMMEDQTHRISYLLRPKTNPGEQPKIKSIVDLKGMRVGILPTVAYKAWLEFILKANGVEGGVQIQQVDPTLQAQSLKSGGVDALFTNDPVATSAIQMGVAELVSDIVECPRYIKDPFPFGSLNAAKEWADSHPKVFKKLVAAIDEAVAFVNSNPSDAKQCMKPYLPEQFRAHTEKYPDALYLSTGKTDERTYQETAQMYVGMGIIEKNLDLSGLVVTQK